jgi:hypothetical protein
LIALKERDCLASKGKKIVFAYVIAAAGIGGRVEKASVKKTCDIGRNNF